MNLIYYNSFAEHMRKTYTSDCSIYLESRGVMELMAGGRKRPRENSGVLKIGLAGKAARCGMQNTFLHLPMS